MLLSAAVVTSLGILLALLLAFLPPYPQPHPLLDHPGPQHLPALGAPRATFQPSRLRLRSLTIRRHAVVVGKMAPSLAPKMEAETSPPRTARKN